MLLFYIGRIIDYKEQVFITGFELNMQYLIYHIPQKKKVNNTIIGAINLSINLKLTSIIT